ncbi:MAG TPA: SgcJ/EcaC family oxidoreductase [Pseudonocardiaceae bacterium]|nr:SgcJ/EcaC family oxidoreductase [Pseudonocardiaceae bacterium]
MAQFGNPRETVKAAEAAINAGDLEAMVSLYEREALFISSGQVAAGLEAIRETIAGFLATKPSFELNVASLHQAGDLALEYYEWKLEGTDPDGKPMVLSGTGSAVLRRQADGRWLYVIDNPFPFD